MKKILSIVLIMIMAFAVIGNAAARPDMKRSFSGDALEDAEIIMFIPSGGCDYAIGYYEDDGYVIGPESFAVSNGNVYVLDTVNNRVIEEEAGYMRCIPLEGMNQPGFLAVAGDYLIVIDESCIKVINLNGEDCGELLFPEDTSPDDVYRIYGSNNELYLLTHNLVCYKTDPAVGEWTKVYDIDVDGKFEETECISLPGAKVNIGVGTTSLVQYIQHAENEILVGVYEFVPYLPVIEAEYTVRKYDMRGQLLGCTVINDLEAYSLPNTAVYVDSATSIVYTMLCREEGVYITKPNLRMEYQSHIDELAEVAEQIVGKLEKNLPTRNTTYISLTRQEVLERANDAWSVEWELQAVNKNISVLSDPVTLPCQVANANPGADMQSIPYCFGGYFTDIEDGFLDLLDSSVTGNIIHGNHVDGTIGLDCSGFVSYAYNITYHGTTTLGNYGNYVNGDAYSSTMSASCSLANLTQMDFLVYTAGAHGNHVLLFHSLTEDGKIKTRESTTMNNSGGTSTTKHGVKIRTVALNVLYGYVLYTPYACGGTASHSWSGYHHNSSKHWKECTSGCGEHKNEASHSWSGYVYNSTKHWKECTVCGRHKNEASHTLSDYQYNNYYHWKSCATCGYTTTNEPHCWVHISTGYRCSTCGAYSHQIPLPEKAPIDMETK